MDPGFVDFGSGNLALKADAPVFSKIPGFEPILFDRMGLAPGGGRDSER